MRKSFLALLVTASLFPMTAQADVIGVNNEVGISINGLLQKYQEISNGTVPDSESGVIPGAGIKVSVMHDVFGISHVYAAVSYRYDLGSASYHGGYQNGSGNQVPLNSSSYYHIQNIKVRVGKGFLLNDNFLVTPYLQFEHHNWDREVAGVGAVMGAHEDYRFDAAGFGVKGDVQVMPRLVLTADVNASETLDSSMRFHAEGGIPGMNFSLGNRPVLGASVGADYRIDGPLHVYTKLAVERFGFAASEVNPMGYQEPTSRTTQISADVGIAYQF
ncbi:hypothetical protein [Thiomonas sp.]